MFWRPRSLRVFSLTNLYALTGSWTGQLPAPKSSPAERGASRSTVAARARGTAAVHERRRITLERQIRKTNVGRTTLIAVLPTIIDGCSRSRTNYQLNPVPTIKPTNWALTSPTEALDVPAPVTDVANDVAAALPLLPRSQYWYSKANRR